MLQPLLRLGVLVSGHGSSLQNLIDRIADGRLAGCEIAVVISSRSDIMANDRAERAGIPLEIIKVKDAPDIAAFSTRVAAALDRHCVALAVQAGWLCYWRLPERWLGRVINVHPALLPDFGGKGCFGKQVHAMVLAAKRRESGATVHWVDNEYDHGPILMQSSCIVEKNDTPESLAARVQGVERDLLPAAIAAIRDGAVAPPAGLHA